MAKLTTAEFIAAIKELTVLELNELVKACEEEFGVSAAAGVVMAGPAAAAEEAATPAAETATAATSSVWPFAPIPPWKGPSSYADTGDICPGEDGLLQAATG